MSKKIKLQTVSISFIPELMFILKTRS